MIHTNFKSNKIIAVENAIEVIKSELDTNGIQNEISRQNQIIANGINHINVTPLVVELTSNYDILETYSLSFKTPEQIAKLIVEKLN